MSHQNSLLSDLAASPIPASTLVYVGQRAKNSFYDYVLDRFQESGLTRTELAQRIGQDRARVSRLLTSPGNWTIETIAELLAGIGSEEVIPNSIPFAGRAPRNGTQDDLLGRLNPPKPHLDQPKSDSRGNAPVIEARLEKVG